MYSIIRFVTYIFNLFPDRLFSSVVAAPCDSDSDNNMRSMNSTLESFSENAWDNYQVHQQLFVINFWGDIII